ncbi:polysaccharide deacetylase [Amylibacter marinus]|uniref:Chitooligosaccharide deacetylase n=1 Tax=Amylibacter marinus TaxID=1475483 RepID=A0ABQ5VV52_9RHOB|nr:allantoinase PuuE [Amylibacter marinus]GLQ35205.1 polysaccharide deacetylase [Amylibacter marinus]
MTRYPRDMRGYGDDPPVVHWPGGAKIALQFVLNYEEGGENNILHGDQGSEAFLSEIVGAQSWRGQRHWNMESIYEYGARSGFWRLHRLFTKFDIPVTVFGVATALARAPEQVAAMQAADWEIASHGLKWIEYKDFTPQAETDHIRQAKRLHRLVTGAPPQGWYTGRCSQNTLDLITADGSFDYISDSYADDLPYWHQTRSQNQLVVPYTLDCNDMRFATPQGFNSGDQFFTYLKDSFDVLYAEGQEGAPKMMSVGLHCRLIGRPGRIQSLVRFIEYVKSKADVWCAKRIDIADHWRKNHPAPLIGYRPSTMPMALFVQTFGGIFEHSPWVATQTWQDELGRAQDSVEGLHSAMCRQFRAASEETRLDVLKAHPDLAGRLAAAKSLTEDSTKEQASAGLDMLTEEERAEFTHLNQQYTGQHGFPFILAVKGLNKDQIMANFKARILNARETEFATACAQVERIALLRLQEIL